MLSSELSNHDFGVSLDKATSARPAYELDDTISIEGSLRMFIEITSGWRLIVSVRVELLDEEVREIPIVSEDYVIKGFGAINYSF